MSKEDIKIINDKVKYRKELYSLIDRNLRDLGAVESDAWKEEIKEKPDNNIIESARHYSVEALNKIISTATLYRDEIQKLEKQ